MNRADIRKSHDKPMTTATMNVDEIEARWLLFGGEVRTFPEGAFTGGELPKPWDDIETWALEASAQVWTGYLPDYENHRLVAGPEEHVEWVAEMLNAVPHLIARIRELEATR